MLNLITRSKIVNKMLMIVGFVILTTGSANADFFDFLFCQDPAK